MPPFLICDPQAGVDKFEVEVDGTSDTSPTEYTPEDMAFLKYDLDSLPDGEHSVRARSGNVWGWSEYSVPFDFIKQLPGVPSGFGLSVD